MIDKTAKNLEQRAHQIRPPTSTITREPSIMIPLLKGHSAKKMTARTDEMALLLAIQRDTASQALQ